jgi:carboxymethylenebutenolidase
MTGSPGGIVLLPAIAGVNDYIRGVRSRLEQAGWKVETVNYFGGRAAPDLSTPQAIRDAVDGVNDAQVLQQAEDAARALRARGAGPVGALGYCIGGGYALLAGCEVDGIAAVANYYGGLRYASLSANKPASPLDRAATLRAPMIAHYGSADRFVPPADVAALEAVLDHNQCSYELFRYAGAPHAFDEEFRPAYRPVASAEAWTRTLTFLRWYLRSP